MNWIKLVVFFTALVYVTVAEFTIDYERDTFLKDGKPYQYISGSIHYFRIPRPYWEDRLKKFQLAGLTAIEMYVPWNYHQLTPDTFDFDGQRDVFKFFEIAQSLGLDVILRGFPYVCAEESFGGLPAWMLTDDPRMKLRQMDPVFMRHVKKWFSVFLPKVKPYLNINGGPIIMVQVENEYGSYYAHDFDYLRQLRRLMMQYLGSNTLFFTTDGDGEGDVKYGTLKGLYSTVDFGTGANLQTAFEPMRKFEPRGPLVNSEFYVGWLDLWGTKHSVVPSANCVKVLSKLLAMKVNVNMYMFHGGTNFGFLNGAEINKFTPQITSYDYDAPLSEAGDITSKYVAIADTVRRYRKLPPISYPANHTKYAYGSVPLQKLGNVFDLLDQLTNPSGPVSSRYPLTMEQIQHFEGYILYRSQISNSFSFNSVLNVSVHDRAYVFLNGIPQGILQREGPTTMTLNYPCKKGDVLDLLIENQGRINFGRGMEGDLKGIVSNVTINNLVLTNWTMFPLNFSRLMEPSMTYGKIRMSQPYFSPSVFAGNIPQHSALKTMPDTFVDTSSWGKGLIFLNDVNLGRYWPSVGPQVTLYAPGCFFKPNSKENKIYVIEFEKIPKNASIDFVARPNLTGQLGSKIVTKP